MSEFETPIDSDLIAAFHAGDESAFTEIFDRFGDRIYSYALNVTDNRDLAADIVSETFVSGAASVDDLDEPGRLRAWLFSLARERVRASGHEARPGSHDDDNGLRREVLEAVEDLGTRDRHLMALHLVEGLEGEDLASAMGIDEANLDVVVSRMRRRVEGALGALLLARLGNPECGQVEEVLGDWDGVYDARVRARLNQHIGSCERCRDRRALLLSPLAALPGILSVAAPPELRVQVGAAVVVPPEPSRDEAVETAPTSPAVPAAPPAVPATPPVVSGTATLPVTASMAPMAGSQAPVLPVETSGSVNDESGDWAKLGIFAVVTVVVGLIGFSVAGRFGPLEISEREAAALFVSSTTTTSLPEEATTTTTSNDQATSTTSAARAAPADIGVGVESVDFGEDGTSAEFEVSNSGGSPGEITVATSSEAIALSAGQASIPAGESVPFQASLNRDEIEEGEITETITVAWEGGNLEIAVAGSHEDNPIIHNPRANPGAVEVDGGVACLATQTTISARVRDTSPLESVVARWNDGSNARETAMAEVGGDVFEGTIGPFNTPQTAEVRVVAFDDRGNAGGATVSVNVLPCP